MSEMVILVAFLAFLITAMYFYGTGRDPDLAVRLTGIIAQVLRDVFRR